jgi:hypothetical protein
MSFSRSIAGLLVLCALVPLGCNGKEPRPGVAPETVLLITVAGLRADHSSAYLYHRATTYIVVDDAQVDDGKGLSLDQQSSEGVLFAQAFAPDGDTRLNLAALHTGQTPRGAQDAPSVAAQLAADGWATHAFVSHPESLGERLEAGFENYHRFDTDFATLAKAIDWADHRDFSNGRPTFVWLHLEAPLFPFEPRELGTARGSVDFAQLFRDPDYPGPADGSASFRESNRGRTLTGEDQDAIVAAYDGEIAQLTQVLSQFLDFFHYAGRTADAWGRTFLVFAGVGGQDLFREGGQWGSPDSLHDSVLHVPLLLRHPDSLTGQRVFRQPVELQDVAPTLLELAGLDVPEEVDGRSLLAITDEYVEREFEDRPAFASLWAIPPVYSVRDTRYRCISTQAADGTLGRSELYDQDIDPHGLRDIAAEQPERVRAMEDALRAWLAEVD